MMIKKMTQEQKKKYESRVAGSKQLCFDITSSETLNIGETLYICMGKFDQYYFSRYPDNEEE